MKNVLFLAPIRKYAETTVKNITEILNKYDIEYTVWGHYSDKIVLTTQSEREGVKVTLLWKDPSEYSDVIRGRHFDAVYGKQELVNAFMIKCGMFVDTRTPNMSLSRYILTCSEAVNDTNKNSSLSEKEFGYIPEIKNAYFNDPVTVVMWSDGTKTMVKCQDGDTYSKEVGLALCISKKAFGNKPNFNNVFKKFIQ